MKKNITLFIISISFGLSSCASLLVQETPNRQFDEQSLEEVLVSGTHFDQEIKDKNWSNYNGENFSQVRFQNYSGGSFVKLDIKKPIEIEFHQVIQLNSGELEFNIIGKNQNFYNDHITSASDHIFKIKFDKPGNYKLHWNGNNANGSYFIEWKESK